MSHSTQIPPIIGHEQLIKIAGKPRFDKGSEKALAFQIEHFNANHKGASATIAGFQTHIHFRSDQVEGACQCPDSDGFDFCQHCVCLCLYANKSAQQILSLSKGPDKSKVLAYLLSQEKQEIAKQCLDLITNDAEQFERYLLKASLNQGDINYSELKSQITELTRKQENLFSQRQVKHFFAKIDRFVEELSLTNREHAPEKMLKVIEHAFLRLIRLLENIDDSNEQRSACASKLRSIYFQLMMSITGRPETKAKRIYTLWLADAFDLLGANIEGHLAADVSEKFIALIQANWKTQFPAKPIMNEKSSDCVKKHSSASIKKEDPATLNRDSSKLKTAKQPLERWQRNKLSRFLLEAAIASGEPEKEALFRNALSSK